MSLFPADFDAEATGALDASHHSNCPSARLQFGAQFVGVVPSGSRQQLDVTYPTNGGSPPIEIDLDAGTATIVVRVPAPERVEESADEPDSPPEAPVH